jgi:hypothetical protein
MDTKTRRSTQPLEEALPGGFRGMGAVVVPGLPFFARDDDNLPEEFYPPDTLDMLKIMRAEGAEIDYAEAEGDHAALELMSFDFWVPIVVFASAALANGVGGLFTEAVLELFGRARAKGMKLYAKVGREEREDRVVEWLELAGPEDAVIEALREFLKPR